MTGLLIETPLDPQQQDYVETLRASGENLLALINDILDFSKIESGRLELENHRFELRRCVADTLDLVAADAAEKGLRLLYNAEESCPEEVVGDVTRVRQVLANLLSNSVKFTSRGEVTVAVTSRESGPDGWELCFSVRDTGVGISSDRVDRIFEMFSQADASTSRRFGGTGLGLSISKHLTEMMGGRIWVASKPGEGSTFYFTVLARRADDAGAEAEPDRIPDGASREDQDTADSILEGQATEARGAEDPAAEGRTPAGRTPEGGPRRAGPRKARNARTGPPAPVPSIGRVNGFAE